MPLGRRLCGCRAASHIYRMARSSGKRSEPFEASYRVLRLRERREGHGRKDGKLDQLPIAERRLEVQLGGKRRPAAYRLLSPWLRRLGMEEYESARLVGVERLWRPRIREYRLPMAWSFQEQSARGTRER